MKIPLLIFFLFLSFASYTQNGPINPLSARSNGISNASVTFKDINSIFNNQAGLAGIEKAGILFSGQQTFVSPDSDNFGVGIAIPSSAGTFGLNMQIFADNELDQFNLGLAYARNLSEQLSLGAQFDLRSTRFGIYNLSKLFATKREDIITFQVGLRYELLENLVFGAHLSNPAKLEIIEDEFLPRVIRFGTTYFITENLLWHAELEKDFDLPFVFKSGLEWELIKELWFRLGFQIKPLNINFGAGYKLKNGLRLEIAAYYQDGTGLVGSGLLAISGFVPSFGIGYDFKNK